MRVVSTWLRLALSSGLILSGCAKPGPSTFRTEPRSVPLLSLSPTLEEVAGLQGEVPASEALRTLYLRKLLVAWPLVSDPTDRIVVAPSSRWADVIKEIETVTGWVYDCDKRRFYEAFATHSMDAPDAFGRPTGEQVSRERRAQVSVQFRFRRIAASVSTSLSNVLDASGTLTTFDASVPDGVQASWSTVDERGYFDNVQGLVGDTAVVQGQRKTVQSGLQFSAITARLPGSAMRIDGNLTVSSFAGNSLDRSVVTLPVQVDGPRYEWVPVLRISLADASMRAAFRGRGFDASGGGSDVLVEVRVN